MERTENRWYLGIDIGTGGLSAALLDGATSQHYLILWQQEGTEPVSFVRLPAVVYLSAEQLQRTGGGDRAEDLQVGDRAIKAASRAADPDRGLLLGNLRQALSLAIPYRPSPEQDWEPGLQWSDQQQVSLTWMQRGTISLLKTLRPAPSDSALQRVVDGLSPEQADTALSQLAAVIISCPMGETDAYRFNLREAVLEAGLVDRPDQVFFVEDAIAALIAELPVPQPTNQFSPPSAQQAEKEPLQGNTLVISAGANLTELLLVNLPTDLGSLKFSDLHYRSVAYAGNAIDQDIICQLLYPSVWGWRSLGSPSLDLPLAGEPDLPIRYRFQQRLRDGAVGQNLLRLARQLKLALTQQDTYTINVDDQTWTITQQDFHNRVVIPYIQILNRELNILLTQTGMVAPAIKQVLCAGGTTSIPAIAAWLQQKLPKSRLIRDESNSITASSRIAVGLATLPLFPSLLNLYRHQYGDYFLLRKLVQTLSDQPFSVAHGLKLLEVQGIDTQLCQTAVTYLLEGQLPTGLVPSRQDFVLLAAQSQQNPEYRTIMGEPLFLRQGNQVYRLNPHLRDSLLHYLELLLRDKHQTLENPLVAELGVRTQ